MEGEEKEQRKRIGKKQDRKGGQGREGMTKEEKRINVTPSMTRILVQKDVIYDIEYICHRVYY